MREIVIHSLAQADAALRAAKALGVSVTLASAPDAALQTGPAWFKEVIAAAIEAQPGVAVTSILDCGDEPAAVMAALRLGLTRLRFKGPEPVRAKLQAMGAEFAAAPDATLDLLNAHDPEAACRAFLALPDHDS